ncbi:MAG TPA: hypothetical protein VKP30_30310 [Polyangiaceae bacterium]|nr:hypothetical protein [Polyangiaceae bacterium]
MRTDRATLKLGRACLRDDGARADRITSVAANHGTSAGRSSEPTWPDTQCAAEKLDLEGWAQVDTGVAAAASKGVHAPHRVGAWINQWTAFHQTSCALHQALRRN